MSGWVKLGTNSALSARVAGLTNTIFTEVKIKGGRKDIFLFCSSKSLFLSSFFLVFVLFCFRTPLLLVLSLFSLFNCLEFRSFNAFNEITAFCSIISFHIVIIDF